jgi:hypothetical protein
MPLHAIHEPKLPVHEFQTKNDFTANDICPVNETKTKKHKFYEKEDL